MRKYVMHGNSNLTFYLFLALIGMPMIGVAETDIEQVDLFVDSKREQSNSCHFTVRLHNTTSHRVRNVVPQFSAINKDDMVYGTISREFYEIRPNGEQERSIRFRGITCDEIIGLRIHGANNCRMGTLNRNTATSFECLRRIKVHKSSVVNVFKDEVTENLPVPNRDFFKS